MKITDPEIQWGSLLRLASGADDVETAWCRSAAMSAVDNTNRRVGEGSAKLVYRTVKYGEWHEGTIGNEWGVRRTWPDGYTEIQPASSRDAAERTVRLHYRQDTDGVVATRVSRTVTYGYWWLAPEATPE